MKSERLYYHNSYLIEFDSTVIERTTHQNRPAVVLAASAFYPTMGGQPHDTGWLNDTPVIEVVAEDGNVLHILGGELRSDEVHGKIDWQRRFDNMIHHTGQHILTRAFIEVADAFTVSFHLSENSVTIDLDTKELSQTQIDAAEDLANRILAENRAVRAWFPEPDELAKLQLRKLSEKVTGAVRVVDVGGFDLTACGGTHVAHTGEIGLIKVLRLDKKGSYIRVEFICGQRALADYRAKNLLVNDLMSKLTTSADKVAGIFEKFQEENRTLSRQLKAAKTRLIALDADELWQQASSNGYPVIVKQVLEGDKSDVQDLASLLSQRPNTVALIGMAGEQAHLVFARSEDASGDMAVALKAALASLNSQRGGGRPNMAQGGGVPATVEQVQAALDVAQGTIQN